jgi:hypothetical protein
MGCYITTSFYSKRGGGRGPEPHDLGRDFRVDIQIHFRVHLLTFNPTPSIICQRDCNNYLHQLKLKRKPRHSLDSFCINTIETQSKYPPDLKSRWMTTSTTRRSVSMTGLVILLWPHVGCLHISSFSCITLISSSLGHRRRCCSDLFEHHVDRTCHCLQRRSN